MSAGTYEQFLSEVVIRTLLGESGNIDLLPATEKVEADLQRLLHEYLKPEKPLRVIRTVDYCKCRNCEA
ncbi:MAG TPA: hypothetical protein VFF28_00130 [Candidatus Nanoarchaeia archaeon]|nr:hypothetical protein [Candidatus Nanoarchaeia archaeon]